jgi:hypothetical protein
LLKKGKNLVGCNNKNSKEPTNHHHPSQVFVRTTMNLVRMKKDLIFVLFLLFIKYFFLE